MDENGPSVISLLTVCKSRIGSRPPMVRQAYSDVQQPSFVVPAMRRFAQSSVVPSWRTIQNTSSLFLPFDEHHSHHQNYEVSGRGSSFSALAAQASAVEAEASGHAGESPTKLAVKSSKNGRERIPEGTLCVVCGDLASGIHYSVASCNGCKTFFRRALVNKQTFECQFNGECAVGKSVRCVCRCCRLKKCFDMGMDPKAIQHDRDKIRYTKVMKRQRDEMMATQKAIKEEVTSPVISDSNEHSTTVTPLRAQSDVPTDGPHAPVAPPLTGMMPSIPGMPSLPGLPSTMPNLPLYPQPAMLSEVLSMVEEMSKVEKRIVTVRDACRFAPHDSATFSMYSDCLLLNEEWLRINSEPLAQHPPPEKCDQAELRKWFCRDLTLMIEFVKRIPTTTQLLLNDKAALLKAYASSYPVLQLAFYNKDNSPQLQNTHAFSAFKRMAPSQSCSSPMTDTPCTSRKISSLALSSDSASPEIKKMRLTDEPGSKTDDDDVTIIVDELDEDDPSPASVPNPDPPPPAPPPPLTKQQSKGKAQQFSTDRLAYPDGHYIMKGGPNNKIPDAVHEMMTDGVCGLLRRLNIDQDVFVLFKILLFFNNDTDGLSTGGKEQVKTMNEKLTELFFVFLLERRGIEGLNVYANLLMLRATLTRIRHALRQVFLSDEHYGCNDLVDQLIVRKL